MRAILTIAWKDLKNLLTSPLLYIIAGLCSLQWTYTFLRMIMMFAEKSRTMNQPGSDSGLNLQREVFLPHVSQINLIFILFVPALTMRLLAEEKRTRTYDLLLTSPITATQIALGKFLAGMGAVSVLALVSLLYPLFTLTVADFPLAPVFSAYLGVLLVASAYVAVGLFASSLTDSLFLAVFLGWMFNLILWFISQGAGDETAAWLNAVLEYMSVGQHFYGFVVGSVKLSSVVFFGSVATLFVFLTQRVVESSRWR